MVETENPQVEEMTPERYRLLSDKQKLSYWYLRAKEDEHELVIKKQALNENTTTLSETKSVLSDAKYKLEKLEATKKAIVEKNILFGKGRKKGNKTGFCHPRLNGAELNDLCHVIHQYLEEFRLKGISNEYTKRLHQLKRKMEANRDRVLQFNYVVQDKGFETEKAVAVLRKPREQPTTGEQEQATSSSIGGETAMATAQVE
jgi:hypothetical protein